MEKNTQTKAVIYCRVSTKEQAEEGNSLITQERNCRDYASKNNYDISQVFIEEGESAKTADRTELQKLLRFCSDRKENIKAVIIYKIDRLSRNTDDYSQLRILLKRYGVEIKSTSEYFENTPAGRFMENIIANVAQFDNDVRTERSVGGMKDAVREGRYVWRAPHGYKNEKVDGKSTIVQSDKAYLVRKGFELVAEKRYSLNAILETLSDMGLEVSRSFFYSMLGNELYAGWIKKFGERHKGKFEPIIPEELFNRVQQVMRNKKTPLTYTKENPDFPLRRFIIHPKKHKLTGAWSKGRNKKYAYYRFVGTGLQWTKDDLETSFYTFMDQYAFDKVLLDKLKKEITNKFTRKSENKAKEIESITYRKAQLKERQNVLLQKNLKGIINDAFLKEQLANLDEEIWAIDRILVERDERKVDLQRIFDFISEFLIRPSITWKKMPLHLKLKLQWFQFPNGVLFDGKKFRTTKISSIFKLKPLFLGEMSSNVHYPGLNYEHTNSANFSALQIDKNVVWEEIKQELCALENIIQTFQ